MSTEQFNGEVSDFCLLASLMPYRDNLIENRHARYRNVIQLSPSLSSQIGFAVEVDGDKTSCFLGIPPIPAAFIESTLFQLLRKLYLTGLYIAPQSSYLYLAFARGSSEGEGEGEKHTYVVALPVRPARLGFLEEADDVYIASMRAGSVAKEQSDDCFYIGVSKINDLAEIV